MSGLELTTKTIIRRDLFYPILLRKYLMYRVSHTCPANGRVQ
jgi:hypothetical protein